MVYADTSFLASLYLNDANSSDAIRLAGTGIAPCIVTPFGKLELFNAIRLARFRKMISPKQERSVFSAIAEDRGNGFLDDTPVAWSELLDRAEAISAKHTAVSGIRTLDLLHIAGALTLSVKDFLTFDLRQHALADIVGLNVVA